jgi:hypothetical protein
MAGIRFEFSIKRILAITVCLICQPPCQTEVLNEAVQGDVPTDLILVVNDREHQLAVLFA